MPPASTQSGTPKPPTPLAQHGFTFRVRYSEVDAMGYLHHSRFLQYFEMGRVELLRSRGVTYRQLEDAGVLFVVTRAEVKYRRPARYDDELTLTTRLIKQTHVRFDHTYALHRGQELLATGETTIACVDRQGQVIQIPENVRVPEV